MESSHEPSVVLQDIEKSFGANKVLKGVTLPLYSGKITALLGANGAGKSTLIKILSGVYDASAGRILVQGKPVEIENPMDATRHGIHTVHQRVDENIVPDLSVAENLVFPELVSGEARAIGSPNSRMPRARDMLRSLGLEWPDSKLAIDAYDLTIADQQLLLLARALDSNPEVLVLDEPTSTLSVHEAERLFEVVRRLRAGGVAILYVSHHLSEIRDLADELAVLRDGVVVEQQQAPLNMEQAVRSMLGSVDTDKIHQLDERRGDEIALKLSNVQLLKRSRPFDLDIRYGEVTGVLGLIGAGKSELARGIVGADKFISGTMELDGEPFAPKHVAEAVGKRVFLVPEDRAEESMLPEWDIARTVSLPFMDRVSRRGVLNFRREAVDGDKIIDAYHVVASGSDQQVDALSGGNQQKVIVGRWLSSDPSVMLLDEPFRGVDIGARREISRKARQVAESGAAVVVCSSDVEEILEVSDRIVVLVEGRIVHDSYNTETDPDEIMRSMSQEEQPA